MHFYSVLLFLIYYINVFLGRLSKSKLHMKDTFSASLLIYSMISGSYDNSKMLMQKLKGHLEILP
jgi:hypothetical protein